VTRVLEELDLVEQGDTLIRNLSGGERRRAACGLELVGGPRVLLLDEPTSGLDLVLERRLMELFRRLADHGRAVLVATHATASLDLCDEVVLLDRGVIANRGAPHLARAHLESVARRPDPTPRPAPVALAEEATVGPVGSGRPVRVEFAALAGRYARTILRDTRTLALLIGQAPLIGVLIGIVFGSGALSAAASPTDAVELTLMLMTAATWLGVSSACREVVKERGLVERDFDFGVRLDAYVIAKAVVLFALTFVQVVLLAGVVLVLQPLHLRSSAYLEVFVITLFTAWASVAMGFLASCLARSVDQAAGVVPLLLMPQLLFAGGLVPTAEMPPIVRLFSNVVYARWAYAGLGSAANLQGRLSEASAAGLSLGYGSTFFTIRPGAAVVLLLAFTFIQLLAAMFVLMFRPRNEQ
jgi:energy-coupling factor transporter ATP-binding protein EcfA2